LVSSPASSSLVLATDHGLAFGSADTVNVDVETFRQHTTYVLPPRGAVSWPVQVGNPPLLAAAFQPRHELLDQLAMTPEGGAVVTQLVAGDGGVGKTQLAVAAFEQAAAAGVELRVWVTASSRSPIVTGLAEAYAQVDAPGAVVQGETDRAAAAFLSWLATTRLSWLVVYDDVTDPADVWGLWPRGPAGRVIVTTRRRDLTVRGAVLVPVGVFTPEQSVAYLTEKLTGTRTDPPARAEALDGAAELAEYVGHLPLALAQAAAMIAFDGITCAEYRALLADRSRTLRALFPPGAPADEYAQTVASAWSLAIERANRLDPVGLAGPVLELAAILDPNGAPVSLWCTEPALAYFAARVDQIGTAPAVSAESTWRALRNLNRLSLITHNPDPATMAGVRMHMLLQRAVIETLPDATLPGAVRAAADALLATWPEVDRDPVVAGVLRQNTNTLSERSEDALWQSAAHPVLHRAGRSLGEAGQVWVARDYHAALAAAYIARLGPAHPSSLTARSDLAYWRGRAGDAAGAAVAFEQLLADYAQVLGTDHPNTLAARANLAQSRGAAGDAAGAAAAYEELVAEMVQVLGPDHSSTLTARNNLAGWRGEAGDTAGAVAAFEELLADRARVLGSDHPDTLTTRNNLASSRGEAGDTARAVAAFEELLADRMRVLGADHPDTLSTRGNLAYWRGEAGDAAGAAEAFEQLLADRVRVLGPDNPDTLATRSNVAGWRGTAGDAAGAAEVLKQLLADQLRVVGPDHPDTLATRSNLARWRGEGGDAAAAAAAFEELLADRVRMLGPDHPDTLATRASLAHWRGEAGDAAGAAAAFEELLPDRLRVLGPDHPATLATRASLARWRGEAGDAAGAAAAFEELLADQLRVLGPNHPATLATRGGLAHWRGRAGDAAGAEHALTELLVDRVRVLGPDHPDTLTTRNNVAYWRGEAGDAAGAAAAFEKLLADRMRVLGPSHPATLITRYNLATWREESAKQEREADRR
jgi:hypothetical protein